MNLRKDWVFILTCILLLVSVVVLMRLRYKKEDFGASDPECYKIDLSAGIPFSDAAAVCTAFGGAVATLAQLQTDVAKGAQWCGSAWMKNATGTALFGYPMQEYYPGCGSQLESGTNPAAINWLSAATDRGAAIICYGVKPARGTPGRAVSGVTATANTPFSQKTDIWSIQTAVSEVYQVIIYNATGTAPVSVPYATAVDIAKKLGATVASITQMTDAYLMGAQWCQNGWTLNNMVSYPMQDAVSNCGTVGLNSAGPITTTADFPPAINCYGPKASRTVSDNKINYFNASGALTYKLGLVPFSDKTNAWNAPTNITRAPFAIEIRDMYANNNITSYNPKSSPPPALRAASNGISVCDRTIRYLETNMLPIDTPSFASGWDSKWYKIRMTIAGTEYLIPICVRLRNDALTGGIKPIIVSADLSTGNIGTDTYNNLYMDSYYYSCGWDANFPAYVKNVVIDAFVAANNASSTIYIDEVQKLAPPVIPQGQTINGASIQNNTAIVMDSIYGSTNPYFRNPKSQVATELVANGGYASPVDKTKGIIPYFERNLIQLGTATTQGTSSNPRFLLPYNGLYYNVIYITHSYRSFAKLFTYSPGSAVARAMFFSTNSGENFSSAVSLHNDGAYVTRGWINNTSGFMNIVITNIADTTGVASRISNANAPTLQTNTTLAPVRFMLGPPTPVTSHFTNNREVFMVRLGGDKNRTEDIQAIIDTKFAGRGFRLATLEQMREYIARNGDGIGRGFIYNVEFESDPSVTNKYIIAAALRYSNSRPDRLGSIDLYNNTTYPTGAVVVDKNEQLSAFAYVYGVKPAEGTADIIEFVNGYQWSFYGQAYDVEAYVVYNVSDAAITLTKTLSTDTSQAQSVTVNARNSEFNSIAAAYGAIWGTDVSLGLVKALGGNWTRDAYIANGWTTFIPIKMTSNNPVPGGGTTALTEVAATQDLNIKAVVIIGKKPEYGDHIRVVTIGGVKYTFAAEFYDKSNRIWKKGGTAIPAYTVANIQPEPLSGANDPTFLNNKEVFFVSYDVANIGNDKLLKFVNALQNDTNNSNNSITTNNNNDIIYKIATSTQIRKSMTPPSATSFGMDNCIYGWMVNDDPSNTDPTKNIVSGFPITVQTGLTGCGSVVAGVPRLIYDNPTWPTGVYVWGVKPNTKKTGTVSVDGTNITYTIIPYNDYLSMYNRTSAPPTNFEPFLVRLANSSEVISSSVISDINTLGNDVGNAFNAKRITSSFYTSTDAKFTPAWSGSGWGMFGAEIKPLTVNKTAKRLEEGTGPTYNYTTNTFSTVVTANGFILYGKKPAFADRNRTVNGRNFIVEYFNTDTNFWSMYDTKPTSVASSSSSARQIASSSSSARQIASSSSSAAPVIGSSSSSAISSQLVRITSSYTTPEVYIITTNMWNINLTELEAAIQTQFPLGTRLATPADAANDASTGRYIDYQIGNQAIAKSNTGNYILTNLSLSSSIALLENNTVQITGTASSAPSTLDVYLYGPKVSENGRIVTSTNPVSGATSTNRQITSYNISIGNTRQTIRVPPNISTNQPIPSDRIYSLNERPITVGSSSSSARQIASSSSSAAPAIGSSSSSARQIASSSSSAAPVIGSSSSSARQIASSSSSAAPVIGSSSSSARQIASSSSSAAPVSNLLQGNKEVYYIRHVSSTFFSAPNILAAIRVALNNNSIDFATDAELAETILVANQNNLGPHRLSANNLSGPVYGAGGWTKDGAAKNQNKQVLNGNTKFDDVSSATTLPGAYITGVKPKNVRLILTIGGVPQNYDIFSYNYSVYSIYDKLNLTEPNLDLFQKYVNKDINIGTTHQTVVGDMYLTPETSTENAFLKYASTLTPIKYRILPGIVIGTIRINFVLNGVSYYIAQDLTGDPMAGLFEREFRPTITSLENKASSFVIEKYSGCINSNFECVSLRLHDTNRYFRYRGGFTLFTTLVPTSNTMIEIDRRMFFRLVDTQQGSSSSSMVRQLASSSSSAVAPTIGSSSSSMWSPFGSSSSSGLPGVIGSSSSSFRGIASSSSSAAPITAPTTIGSSSSSAAPRIGSSSSSAAPTIGSSSSSAAPRIGSSSSSAAPTIGSSSSSSVSRITPTVIQTTRLYANVGTQIIFDGTTLRLAKTTDTINDANSVFTMTSPVDGSTTPNTVSIRIGADRYIHVGNYTTEGTTPNGYQVIVSSQPITNPNGTVFAGSLTYARAAVFVLENTPTSGTLSFKMAYGPNTSRPGDVHYLGYEELGFVNKGNLYAKFSTTGTPIANMTFTSVFGVGSSSSSAAFVAPFGSSSSSGLPGVFGSSSSSFRGIGSSSSSAAPITAPTTIGSSSSSAALRIGSSSSSAPFVSPIGSSSSSAALRIGSSSSSAAPTIGSSSSSTAPTIGSSSSSAPFVSPIGSSSSSAAPTIGSSSSSSVSRIAPTVIQTTRLYANVGTQIIFDGTTLRLAKTTDTIKDANSVFTITSPVDGSTTPNAVSIRIGTDGYIHVGNYTTEGTTPNGYQVIVSPEPIKNPNGTVFAGSLTYARAAVFVLENTPTSSTLSFRMAYGPNTSRPGDVHYLGYEEFGFVNKGNLYAKFSSTGTPIANMTFTSVFGVGSSSSSAAFVAPFGSSSSSAAAITAPTTIGSSSSSAARITQFGSSSSSAAAITAPTTIGSSSSSASRALVSQAAEPSPFGSSSSSALFSFGSSSSERRQFASSSSSQILSIPSVTRFASSSSSFGGLPGAGLLGGLPGMPSSTPSSSSARPGPILPPATIVEIPRLSAQIFPVSFDNGDPITTTDISAIVRAISGDEKASIRIGTAEDILVATRFGLNWCFPSYVRRSATDNTLAVYAASQPGKCGYKSSRQLIKIDITPTSSISPFYVFIFGPKPARSYSTGKIALADGRTLKINNFFQTIKSGFRNYSEGFYQDEECYDFTDCPIPAVDEAITDAAASEDTVQQIVVPPPVVQVSSQGGSGSDITGSASERLIVQPTLELPINLTSTTITEVQEATVQDIVTIPPTQVQSYEVYYTAPTTFASSSSSARPSATTTKPSTTASTATTTSTQQSTATKKTIVNNIIKSSPAVKGLEQDLAKAKLEASQAQQAAIQAQVANYVKSDASDKQDKLKSFYDPNASFLTNIFAEIQYDAARILRGLQVISQSE